MADFGSLAEAGAQIQDRLPTPDKILSSVKSAAVDTFTGNRVLTVNFPKEVQMPTNAGGVDSTYKFKWKWEKTYRFRSAYYSHIRITADGEKQHAKKATKKAVKKLHGSSKDGKKEEKEFEKSILDKVQGVLAEKYAKKYRDALAVLDKEHPKRGAEFNAAWAAFNNAYCRKYKVTIDLAAALIDQSVAGKALAAAIVKSKKYTDKVAAATESEWRKRQEELIKAKHPGMSPEQVRSKVSRAVARQVAGSGYRSVVIAYEVQYAVYSIDELDVARRWTEIEGALQKEKQETIAKARQGLMEANALLRGGGMQADGLLKDQAGEADTIATVREMMAESKQEMEAAKNRFAKRMQQLKDQKKVVADYVANWKAIGAFGIYPVGSCGDLKTGIKWRNTNATITASAEFRPDLSVGVHFDWQEESKTSIPKIGDKLLANTYSTAGYVTFYNDGTYKAEDKIGARFEELCQPMS